MSSLILVPSSIIHELEFEIKEIYLVDSDSEGVTGEVTEPVYYQSAWGEVEYVADFQGQELTLSFDWTGEANGKASYKESFDFDVGYCFEPDEKRNFIFIDEDGDEEDFSVEEIESIAESFEDFRNAAFHLLPRIEEDEVLIEREGTDMKDYEEYIVERDNDVDLRFTGKLLAETSSRDPYNDRGRWFDLSLYQTVGGKFICQKEDITRWQGEHNRNQAEVCQSLEEVKAFFGNGWASKELYANAGIDNTENVE